MRPWWEILDIEKTANHRAIKRAYAAKLKTIRQDENPAEFMELREAYEAARGGTRTNMPMPSHIAQFEPNSSPAPRSSVPEPATETSPPDRIDNILNAELDAAAPRPQTGPTHLETFLKNAGALMNSATARNRIEDWKALFHKLESLSLDDYTDFEHGLTQQMLATCENIIAAKQKGGRRLTHMPHIMNFEAASYVFDHFSWNDPGNPNRFNHDISTLRDWLDVHTQKADLTPKVEPKDIKFSDDKTWWYVGLLPLLWIIFRLLVVLNVISDI